MIKLTLSTVISLAATPLFLAGAVWEYMNTLPICGSRETMISMWLIMAVAHTPPWFTLKDQLRLQRYRSTFPDKQQ